MMAFALMAMLPMFGWSQDNREAIMRNRLAGQESRTWTWNTEAPYGYVWGNMGYHGAPGHSVAFDGEGLWWGVSSEEDFLGQLPYQSDTHVPTGEESMKATMTFYADGFICSNDAQGNRIRQGLWSIVPNDDINDDMKEGDLNTSAGSILFPFAINRGGEKPTHFEILSLTNSTLTLCYAEAGQGEWGEATFWQFKAQDEGNSDYTCTVDGICYEVLSERNRTCQVIYSKPNPSLTVVNIASEVTIGGKSYAVTRIDGAAFAKWGNIQSVTIPESVTEIGSRAFSGSSLQSITLPNSITEIKDGTFMDCSNLSAVTLRNNLKTIGADAFSRCSSLTEITLPASLTTVGKGAFDRCWKLNKFVVASGNPTFKSFSGVIYDPSLTKLLLCPPGRTGFDVPEDIIEIGMGAFYGSALKTVNLPSGLQRIGDDAFSGCSELQAIDIPASVTELGVGAFWACTSLTEVEIPEGVETLNKTFGGCSNLRSVVLPESLIELYDQCFYNCTSLESITLPASVRVMDGWGIFYECTQMKTINCWIEQPINIDVLSTLSGIDSQSTLYVPYQSLYAYNQSAWNVFLIRALPETVPNDTHSTFYYTTNDGSPLSLYTDRTLFIDPTGQPLQVLSHTQQSDGSWAIELSGIAFGIADNAFYNQYNLKTVALPASIVEIGKSAFSFCDLSDINIPEGVFKLQDEALRGNNFESLTLPQSLQNIEYGALANCHNLRSLDIPAHVQRIDEQWDLTALETITVGKDNHHFRSPNQSNVIITNYDKVILGCRNSVIPEGVTAIGTDAFAYCPLTSITLPESLEHIYSDAFYNCHELTSIHIPKNVQRMYAAFTSCDRLNSITVDLQNPYFDSREDCNAIIETATNTLVQGCSTTVIPASVTTIGDYAYYGQSGLTYILIPNTVTSIGYRAFAFSGLTSITIPYGLQTIEAYAFSVCNNLERINLPSSIERIGQNAFGGDNYNHLFTTQHFYWYTDKLPKLDGDIFSQWNWHTFHVPADRVDYFWDAFANLYQYSVEPLPSDLEIQDDATTFEHPYEVEYSTVSYIRQFNSTNWQALYVPFELTYDNWSDSFEVARINNFHQYDLDHDGKADETVMEAFVVKDGRIKANYPYLIRAKEVGEKTLNLGEAVVKPAEELGYQCASMDHRYTFHGTYHQIPGETMYSQGYYAMGGGNLITAEDDAAGLGAFRWYLDITDLDGSKLSLQKATLRIVGEESESGIDTIGYESEWSTPTPVGIDGRLLQSPRGIFIMNGQKMLKY